MNRDHFGENLINKAEVCLYCKKETKLVAANIVLKNILLTKKICNSRIILILVLHIFSIHIRHLIHNFPLSPPTTVKVTQDNLSLENICIYSKEIKRNKKKY